MLVTTKGTSGLWYDENTNSIKYSNKGNLHAVPGFKGLVTGSIVNRLMSLKSVTHKDLPASVKFALDSKIISCIDSLATDSDYKKVSDGYELILGRTLHTSFDFSDQFTDCVDLFSYITEVPSEDELEAVLSNPSELGTEVRESKIVKKFDNQLNIVSYLPLNQLDFICRYQVYDLNGDYIEYRYCTGSCNSKYIQIPKVANELHRIKAIQLRYIL